MVEWHPVYESLYELRGHSCEKIRYNIHLSNSFPLLMVPTKVESIALRLFSRRIFLKTGFFGHEY